MTGYVALVNITEKGYKCKRCRHQWKPRKTTVGEPKVCPKCKSPYWNRAYKYNLKRSQQN